jgi:hypothetical protein
MRDRGYRLRDSDDENHCVFYPESKARIFPTILLSQWDENTFRSGIILCSQDVTEEFFEKDLWLDKAPSLEEDSVDVLSVSLLWLRWNNNPSSMSNYRDDYRKSFEFGCVRFFEDLDIFGTPFISSLSTPDSLAKTLENIDEYPINIKQGGKPRSTDPFIYSAILYMRNDKIIQAQEALQKGKLKYACANPDIEWQHRRSLNYNERMSRILRV